MRYHKNGRVKETVTIYYQLKNESKPSTGRINKDAHSFAKYKKVIQQKNIIYFIVTIFRKMLIHGLLITLQNMDIYIYY